MLSDPKTSVCLDETDLDEISHLSAVLDRTGDFPTECVALLMDRGILKAVLPRSFGGAGLGTERQGCLPLALLLMQIGRRSLSLGRLFEGHANAARLIFEFGSIRLQEIAARDIRAGHLMAIWNTEVPGEPVRLDARDGQFIVNGKKIFASGVGHVDRAVISARQIDGTNRLVYLRFSIGDAPANHDGWDLHGMRATATGAIDLSGIMVVPDCIFGEPDDYLKEPDFSAGAWRTLAVQAGGIAALFDVVIGHLWSTEHDKAVPQKMRLAKIVAQYQTAKLWVERCANSIDRTDISSEEAISIVKTARSVISDCVVVALDLTKQAVGARAFLVSNPVEKIMRDLDFYLRQPAPDQAKIDVADYFLTSSDARIDFRSL